MKRLTYRDSAGRWVVACNRFWQWFEHKYPAHIRGEACDRLAAYEDTGLEPEEITVLCDMDRRAKMAEMLRLEESTGVSIDRLRELAEADREGHCIVFDLHYPVASEYYKDEDGLFIREASGVVSKEEYEAALRREQE